MAKILTQVEIETLADTLMALTFRNPALAVVLKNAADTILIQEAEIRRLQNLYLQETLEHYYTDPKQQSLNLTSNKE